MIVRRVSIMLNNNENIIRARKELADLKSQMRRSRKTSDREMKTINLELQRQKKVIEALEMEKKNVLLNLHVANSPQKQAILADKKNDVKGKLHLINKYQEGIEKKSMEVWNLQVGVKKLETEIDKIKRQHDITKDGDFQNQDTHTSVQQNRLESENRRLNIILRENECLQQEITHLLLERNKFKAVQSTMLSRLEDSQNAEHDLTGYALITLDKRRLDRSALQRVGEAARSSELLHLDEYRTLGRKKDHLTEISKLKAAKCLAWPEERDRVAQQLEDGLAGWQQERELWTEFVQQVLGHFSSADPQDVATSFHRTEHENMSLFVKVVHLTDEVHRLRNEVLLVLEELEVYRKDHLESSQQLKDSLDKLKKTFDEASKSTQQAEENKETSERVLQFLLKVIANLFQETKCDNSTLQQMFGDETQITGRNVFGYISILEKRINDMVALMSYQKSEHDLSIQRPLESATCDFTEGQFNEQQSPEIGMVRVCLCARCMEMKEMEHYMETGMKRPQAREEANELLKQMGPQLEAMRHSLLTCTEMEYIRRGYVKRIIDK